MTFRWALYDREPLPTWTKGRLTLLGDAAHPMLPHLGQGANQSIEDGMALATIFARSSPKSAPAASLPTSGFAASASRRYNVARAKTGCATILPIPTWVFATPNSRARSLPQDALRSRRRSRCTGRGNGSGLMGASGLVRRALAAESAGLELHSSKRLIDIGNNVVRMLDADRSRTYPSVTPVWSCSSGDNCE